MCYFSHRYSGTGRETWNPNSGISSTTASVQSSYCASVPICIFTMLADEKQKDTDIALNQTALRKKDVNLCNGFTVFLGAQAIKHRCTYTV